MPSRTRSTSTAPSPKTARSRAPERSEKRPVAGTQPAKPKVAPDESKPADTKGNGRHGSGLRSLWKGAISFGMVTIPVRLYPATSSRDLSFNLLHEKCNSRLKQVRWCPVCDQEVPWEEIVRGYEYAKGQYVRLTEEDFEKLPVPSKHTVSLSAFVKQEEIDPIYFEKSYYLDPEPTGRKSFALLLTALEEKQLTAVAKIAIREKERLCALRPAKGTLVLDTLYYADEVREHKPAVGDVQVSDRELDMAYKLIDFLTEDFDPQKYHDEYRDALLEAIEAKLHGEQVVTAPKQDDGKVIDLMEALKASLAAATAEKGSGSGGDSGATPSRTRSRRRAA